jgi:hypothetical protein
MCDVFQPPFRNSLSGDEATFYRTQIWKQPREITNNNNRNWLPLTQPVFCIQLYATTTRKSGAELRQSTNTETNTDKSLLVKTDLQMVR